MRSGNNGCMFRAMGCIGTCSSTRLYTLYFDFHLGEIEKCYIPSLRLSVLLPREGGNRMMQLHHTCRDPGKSA